MPKILGVNIDAVDLKEATKKCIKMAKGSKQNYIATPNPEILLEAEKNDDFKKVLNNSSLNTADGIGILWAAKYLEVTKKETSGFFRAAKFLVTLFWVLLYPHRIKSVFPERVTGADLTMEICKKAQEKGLKIFLLGGAEKVAEKVKGILEKKYKKIQIVGTHSGSPAPKNEKEITTKINKSGAKILFVAFGAPKQELWIARNLSKMPKVKLAAGIGGTFDFIAKVKIRAPKWMQKLGLEWLWRLIQEPKRIKRIYNATVKFPLKIY